MPDFGLSEALIGGLTAAGVGGEAAAASAPFLAGGLEGAALGAGGSLITGSDPLTGALTGGLTGGAVGGFGPAIGEAAGIGTTAGDALAGAGAGAIGSAITGGDALTGALTGGAGGAAAGISGFNTPAASAAPATTVAPGAGSIGIGGGPSAASTAGVSGGGAPVDLTAGAGGFMDANGNPFGSNASQTFGLNAQQAPTTGTVTPAATGAGGGGGTTMGDWSARPPGAGTDIGSKVMGLIEKNPGVLLSGGLLAANMLMGDKPLPGQTALQRQAGEAGTVGRTLEAYQLSGTLPAGLQAAVDQQIGAAKAAIVSQFGAQGLAGSTMMVDKLNQLKQQKSAEMAQFADQLGRQGLDWTRLSATELSQLLNVQLQQDESFNKALGSFASGLAGLRTGSSGSSATA